MPVLPQQCKHLRPIWLRKFKFKSNRHWIIDDDDDIASHNGNNSTINDQSQQYVNNIMWYSIYIK